MKTIKVNFSINKKDLKNALIELFQTGEIKVQVNYEDICQELHVAIDIDDVEVYYGTTPIVFKPEC